MNIVYIVARWGEEDDSPPADYVYEVDGKYVAVVTCCDGTLPEERKLGRFADCDAAVSAIRGFNELDQLLSFPAGTA